MDTKLVEKYAIDAKQRREWKDFLGITSDDEGCLAELRECFGEFAREFAEGFYRHLLSHSETEHFLRDPGLVAQLSVAQMRHFEELLSGNYDEAYFEKRLRVGKVHHDVGLQPKWYLGAYNQYIQLAFPRFAEKVGGEFRPELQALVKVILLDIGLALETYFGESTEQLRQRNDELQQALSMYLQSELKAQQYAKLAGHEIRGSLNAISAACETVAEDFADDLPDEARQLLEQAHRRCLKTVQVVADILSRPEQAGDRNWVEVSQVLGEVASRVDLYADSNDVELGLPAEDVRVWADPIGLREVFANLVSNAVRHTDRESAEISIEYVPSQEEHVFCVADNGQGIHPDLQQQVFEPFVRGPDAVDGEGRGLGLHFVSTIVTQHGGRVWLESVVGRGSRFYFSLPKQSAEQEANRNDPADVSLD